MLDELLELCGLSLIETALGEVAKRVQHSVTPQKAEKTKYSQIIPVVYNGAGLLIINKPADLVVNSNDRDRVCLLDDPIRPLF